MTITDLFTKRLFYFSIPAFLSIIFFPSCQKTTTTSSNIGDWAAINEFGGSPRTQAVSFVINNTVYIGTGYNGNVRLNDFFKYDETSQRWTSIAPFPGAARNGAVAFAIDGKGYVGAGFDGSVYRNDFWQYDPNSDSWIQIADYPDSAMVGAIGFGIGDKGYVAGGSYPYGEIAGYNLEYSESVWSYDTTLKNWTSEPGLIEKRTGSCVFVYNNIAYVVGGTNAFGTVIDVEAFNPNAGTKWSLRRPIISIPDSAYAVNYGYSITRSNTAAFLINDTAYLATGNYNGIIGTVWAYDIANDDWFPKTSFEGNAREGAIGFTINNHGYIATGDNGSNYYDDVWRFFPDATAITSDNYP